MTTPTISEKIDALYWGEYFDNIGEFRTALKQLLADFAERITPGVALAEPLATDKEWAEYEGYNKAVEEITKRTKEYLNE